MANDNTDNSHEYDVLTVMVLEMVQMGIAEGTMTEELVDRVEEYEKRLRGVLGVTS